MNKLEWAIHHAKRNLRVFPGIPNSKLPAIKDFPNRATCDLEKIKKWWSNGHTDANICISTDNLIVIDVDNKGEKKGNEELFRLEIEKGLVLPASLEQRTPTGGRHLIYKTPYAVKQGVN